MVRHSAALFPRGDIAVELRVVFRDSRSAPRSRCHPVGHRAARASKQVFGHQLHSPAAHGPILDFASHGARTCDQRGWRVCRVYDWLGGVGSSLHAAVRTRFWARGRRWLTRPMRFWSCRIRRTSQLFPFDAAMHAVGHIMIACTFSMYAVSPGIATEVAAGAKLLAMDSRALNSTWARAACARARGVLKSAPRRSDGWRRAASRCGHR